MVWDADWEEAKKEEFAGAASQSTEVKKEGDASAASQSTEVKEKKKRVRRVLSGGTDEEEKWEEYDFRREQFVPLNTAIEPEYIDVEEDDEQAP